MVEETLACPNRPGVWRLVPTGQDIDVYVLEPVGDVLCIWGPDVGIGYTGALDTQSIWDTDEWQGHIPVNWYDDVGPWRYVEALL